MVTRLYGTSVHHRGKFHQTVAEILRFYGFSLFVGRTFRPYRCSKFGGNRCSTFNNMEVLIFCMSGLKMPIRAPKIGVLGL